MDGGDGNLPDTYGAGGPARLFGWRWSPSPANPGATPCPEADALKRPAFRPAGGPERPSRTLPLSLASWSSDTPVATLFSSLLPFASGRVHWHGNGLSKIPLAPFLE